RDWSSDVCSSDLPSQNPHNCLRPSSSSRSWHRQSTSSLPSEQEAATGHRTQGCGGPLGEVGRTNKFVSRLTQLTAFFQTESIGSNPEFPRGLYRHRGPVW